MSYSWVKKSVYSAQCARESLLLLLDEDLAYLAFSGNNKFKGKYIYDHFLLSIEATTTTAAATTETTTGPTTTTTTATSSEAATASTTAPSATPTTTGRATASSTTSCLLHTGSLRGLGLGKEALEGQELVATNKDLVVGLERSGDDALRDFDGKMKLVDGAEDLVDLADLCLVLQVDGGVEVGNHLVHRLADHIAFSGVNELAHDYKTLRKLYKLTNAYA